MSSTRTVPEARCIRVPLDPGLLVEALILARLETLPKRRHPDWVRSLLVQGFLAEHRRVRQLDATENPGADRRVPQARRSGFDFGGWVARSTKPQPMAGADRAGPRGGAPSAVTPDAADKPFAHLRQVVG